MGWLKRFGILAVPAGLAWAGATDRAVLDYQMKYQRRSDPTWQECRFRVVTTPALVLHQRRPQPRMGGWRIEAVAGAGPAPGAAILAQAANLMYFSGPTPGLLARDSSMVLDQRRCRLWQVPAAPGVAAYAYLAELAPNLLALSYFSASLRDGDLAAMEIHLTGVELGARPSPPADGTALLRTLARWSAGPPAEVGKLTDAVPTERID
jgi:hypothetical protein